MKRTLKVIEFDKKQELIDYVNSREDEIEIVSISTSQVAFEYKHILWYY